MHIFKRGVLWYAQEPPLCGIDGTWRGAVYQLNVQKNNESKAKSYDSERNNRATYLYSSNEWGGYAAAALSAF